jgi:cyclase
MRNIRLIARLDVKAPNLVKGIQLEGLRKMGDPNEFALKYYEQGIDEILYMDIVASLYERNSLIEIINKATQNIFIPITVGGGIRSIDDVAAVLRAGADKVCINTAAIKDPNIISSVARKFGSQCMVVSIEAKWRDNHWEAFYDNGREPSNIDVVAWAKKIQSLGAGEIVLTSVDKEGTAKGYDVELVKAVSDVVSIPVVASGGMGKLQDIGKVIYQGKADAIAMAHVLHYKHLQIDEMRSYCFENDISVRQFDKN